MSTQFYTRCYTIALTMWFIIMLIKSYDHSERQFHHQLKFVWESDSHPTTSLKKTCIAFLFVPPMQLDHEREQLNLRETLLQSERAALEAEKEAMLDSRVTDNDLVRGYTSRLQWWEGVWPRRFVSCHWQFSSTHTGIFTAIKSRAHTHHHTQH